MTVFEPVFTIKVNSVVESELADNKKSRDIRYCLYCSNIYIALNND